MEELLSISKHMAEEPCRNGRMDTQKAKVLSVETVRPKICYSKILAVNRLPGKEELECCNVLSRVVENVKESSSWTRNECEMVYRNGITIFIQM